MVLSGHGVGLSIKHILIMTPAQIIIANIHSATAHQNPELFCLSFMDKETAEVGWTHKF